MGETREHGFEPVDFMVVYIQANPFVKKHSRNNGSLWHLENMEHVVFWNMKRIWTYGQLFRVSTTLDTVFFLDTWKIWGKRKHQQTKILKDKRHVCFFFCDPYELCSWNMWDRIRINKIMRCKRYGLWLERDTYIYLRIYIYNYINICSTCRVSFESFPTSQSWVNLAQGKCRHVYSSSWRKILWIYMIYTDVFCFFYHYIYLILSRLSMIYIYIYTHTILLNTNFRFRVATLFGWLT